MDDLPGILVVLSGPSGVGKTTVAQRLMAWRGYGRSISMTTRQMRSGEVNGRDYHFVSREEFQRLEAAGELIESAEVHGNFYGTPKEPLRKAITAGQTMLLVIDVDGGEQVKRQKLDALLVFLVPPDQAELVRRLQNRGTEDMKQQTLRLHRAELELDRARQSYDHMVLNQNLDACVAEVDALITQARQKLKQRQVAGEVLFAGLAPR